MSARTPILFAVAAAVIGAGEAVDFQSQGLTDAAQLRTLALPQALLDLAPALLIVGALLLVLAVATAWADVRGRGGPIVRAGLGMVAAGAIWYAVFRVGGDLLSATLAAVPVGMRETVFTAGAGWVKALDVPLMLAWLLGPVVLWIGMRRARRAHWALLVVYLVAVVVEIAFAFVSLPVEGVTTLVAIGSIAAMTRPRTTAGSRIGEAHEAALV